MSTQVGDISLIDKIIYNASTLPLEYQDCLLVIAKAMVFTRNRLSKQPEKAARVNEKENGQ